MNFDTATWRDLVAHLEKLRARESEKLEAPTKDLLETQYIRGKVAAYKELLALPKKPVAPVREDRPE